MRDVDTVAHDPEAAVMDVTALPRAVVRADDGGHLVVALAGDHRGDLPLAVLQHGFPNTPATWRHLAPALVASGYRVAMPWLRGYRPSRPGRQRTSVHRYAADLVTVHTALGGDARAVLVGSDWGAAASWRAAGGAPWRAVVGIAVPPEPAMHGFLTDLDQAWRSRYMLQAQFPVARWVVAQGLRPLVDLWRRWSPARVPTSADLAPLRAALGSPAAVSEALAPYRAALGPALLGRYPAADGPVPSQPTLVVHGVDDGCVDRRYAMAARRVLDRAHPRSTVWLVPGAGHFAHLDRPALVTDAVVSFLTRV